MKRFDMIGVSHVLNAAEQLCIRWNEGSYLLYGSEFVTLWAGK